MINIRNRKLKGYATSLKLKQSTIADAIDKSQALISNYMRGELEIPDDVWEELLRVYPDMAELHYDIKEICADKASDIDNDNYLDYSRAIANLTKTINKQNDTILEMAKIILVTLQKN